MTPEEYISFDEMLDPEQLEELGISQDRDLNQCICRLALAYWRDRSLLNSRTIKLQTYNEATGFWEPTIFEDVDLRTAINDAMNYQSQ